MRLFSLGLTSTLVLLDATTAAADTLFVSPSGSDSAAGSQDEPLRTVQHAVAIAEEGSTINVLPGVYSVLPSVTKPGLSVVAYPESDDAAETHAFTGLNKYPSNFFTVSANETVVRGFTFKQSQGYASIYGLLYVSRFGEVTIENCAFTDNAVGVSVLAGSVHLDSCQFDLSTSTSTNSSGTGISLMYADVGGGGGTVDVHNCSFTGPDGRGTAVNVRDGPAQVNVTASKFEDVFSVLSSGYVSRPITAAVSGSTVKNVIQSFNLYGMQKSKASVDITDCHFNGGGRDDIDGAAVEIGDDVTVTIERSSFANMQGKEGAVLHCGAHATLSVIDSDFTDNTAKVASPGWCSKDCGFVGSGNTGQGNTAGDDEGECKGLL